MAAAAPPAPEKGVGNRRGRVRAHCWDHAPSRDVALCRALARAAAACRNLRLSSRSVMALKVARAAVGAAKAALRPALLWRPWEPPSAKYGGRHTVTMIPGDGIGPELMLHVKSVFRHACVPVDFEEVHVSSTADEEDIRNAIMAIRRNRVALKGNIETNHNLPPSHKSRNNILRTSLDLYANVIHCKSLPGVATRNTGKSIANKNIANPTATLLVSCMMLDHLKLHSYATSIRKAVLASMDNENMHTPDIGGQGTTSEAIQDIIRHIRVINGRAVEA
ncbi:IDH3G [Cervus elaphus hippelaphus]|uniref:IDH3G n=1 Tax=Cervus elaphus hippelaphus TaxID=46360 RepID=A0A212C043_CEREH|nr:IDH3G [Cervus elaphus hippelaphus]